MSAINGRARVSAGSLAVIAEETSLRDKLSLLGEEGSETLHSILQDPANRVEQLYLFLKTLRPEHVLVAVVEVLEREDIDRRVQEEMACAVIRYACRMYDGLNENAHVKTLVAAVADFLPEKVCAEDLKVYENVSVLKRKNMGNVFQEIFAGKNNLEASYFSFFQRHRQKKDIGAPKFQRSLEESVGQPLRDEWEISGAALGEGGFGKVFPGRLYRKGEGLFKVVVKESKMSANAEKPMLSISMKEEIQAQSNLNHPHVTRFYGHVFRKEEKYYVAGLCFEYVGGGNLFSALRQWGKLTRLKSAQIILQIAEGLVHTHQVGNFIHADLKPENILLDSKILDFKKLEKGEFTLKICDFGLARNISELKREGQMKLLCGTRGYIAPECYHTPKGESSQIGNFEPTQIDAYALAVLYLDLRVGFRVQRRAEPLPLRPKLGRGLAFYNERAWSKDNLAPYLRCLGLDAEEVSLLLRAFSVEPEARPCAEEWVEWAKRWIASENPS